MTKNKSTKWSLADSLDLHYLKGDLEMNFSEISKKLNRTEASCKRKWYKTEWSTFLKANKTVVTDLKKGILKDQYVDNLVRGLISLSRNSIARLGKITKDQFLDNSKLQSSTLPVSFTELKRLAEYELKQIGYSYDSSKTFGKGTYIIFGDTHGKHTRSGMFKLLKNMAKHVDADAIIHLGHVLDDDNVANMYLKDMKKLLVVAKEEELRFLANDGTNLDIVRKEVHLGNITVQNQDLVTDYVETYIGSAMKQDYFEESTIVNLHRQEMDCRCLSGQRKAVVASPGCFCDNHIVKTVKQQDYTDGRSVKLTYPEGYKLYRRMKHKNKTWQKGLLVVNVDKDGDYTIHPCRIKETSKGYTTAYSNKIITEDKIYEPHKKGFVITDTHAKFHSPEVLDVVEQVCIDYYPDYFVHLGDIATNEVMSHHNHKKYGNRMEEDLFVEAAAVNFLLKKMSGWAKEKYILTGNHERFTEDFYNRWPQFKTILEFGFLSGADTLGYEIIPLKISFTHSNTTFIHGDAIMYFQAGGHKLDKVFRTYGKNTICGHSHYLASRKDCHIIGYTGADDIGYNEVDASKFTHGLALVNSFEDQ